MHATDQHSALNAAPSAYVYPLLVGQLLTHARGADAGRQIVYRGDVRHSYAQFRERIGRLAGALAALGVGADATVAVMDWDSHRYLESYFAIPMMGATLFTVNVRLSPRQIAHTLRDARASVVVAHADFLPLLEQVRDALGDSTCVIVACDGGAMPATSLPLAGEYERLVAAADPDYPFADFDENARAVLFYTTGTTGDPKGVCYSHRQIVLHALATAAALGAARDGQRLHRDDVYMPITPMFHVMAWGMPYIAVMLGLKIVLPGRYRAHALLDLRQAERVTFSHCVPAVLQMLLDEARLRACDLSGWKMIGGGSARPMPASGLGRQAALAHARAKQADIVITTALIPGRPAPTLISVETVQSMKPGSVLVDLAAGRGPEFDGRKSGNCPLTVADQVIVHHGVTIAGHTNLAAMVPADASSLYARNLFDFLKLIVTKEGALNIDLSDDIVAATLLCRDGEVVRK